jgi:hypothetical protein
MEKKRVQVTNGASGNTASPFDRLLPHSSVSVIHTKIHRKGNLIFKVLRAKFVGGNWCSWMSVISRHICDASNISERWIAPWNKYQKWNGIDASRAMMSQDMQIERCGEINSPALSTEVHTSSAAAGWLACSQAEVTLKQLAWLKIEQSYECGWEGGGGGGGRKWLNTKICNGHGLKSNN